MNRPPPSTAPPAPDDFRERALRPFQAAADRVGLEESCRQVLGSCGRVAGAFRMRGLWPSRGRAVPRARGRARLGPDFPERKAPMHDFWLCFVPLFVAVDAVGVLPMYLGLTEGLEPSRVRALLCQSMLTATAVALAFLFGGKALLEILGITVADFMVAGGILLFAIAMADLLTTEKLLRRVDVDTLGAVPLGVPLITGPAVLTTSILLLDQVGPVPTAVSLVVNMLIAGLLFAFASPIHRVLGTAGAKILSKIASLLLASIAVMIVRKGLTIIFAQ